MKIETKFDIGQEVFILGFYNKVEKHTVMCIQVWRNKETEPPYYIYKMQVGGMYDASYRENQIFQTYEEAMQESIERHKKSLAEGMK